MSVASILPRETIAGVLQLLAGEMQEVDKVIGRSLSSDVALIDQIAHYIVHAGGKRMRPKLVLLFANALSATTPARFELAAVVEFIHTATLLHDDVVDESSLRRVSHGQCAVRKCRRCVGGRLSLPRGPSR